MIKLGVNFTYQSFENIKNYNCDCYNFDNIAASIILHVVLNSDFVQSTNLTPGVAGF